MDVVVERHMCKPCRREAMTVEAGTLGGVPVLVTDHHVAPPAIWFYRVCVGSYMILFQRE